MHIDRLYTCVLEEITWIVQHKLLNWQDVVNIGFWIMTFISIKIRRKILNSDNNGTWRAHCRVITVHYALQSDGYHTVRMRKKTCCVQATYSYCRYQQQHPSGNLNLHIRCDSTWRHRTDSWHSTTVRVTALKKGIRYDGHLTSSEALRLCWIQISRGWTYDYSHRSF